jgi:hypothetical protein
MGLGGKKILRDVVTIDSDVEVETSRMEGLEGLQ